MKINYLIISAFILLLSINNLEAGCGGCGPMKKVATKTTLPEDILTSVPENKLLEGKVEASCGICNFGIKDNDCNLSIRVGEDVFLVKGSGIDDHGDSHADDGFCNAIRIADVKGKIKRGTFRSESFALLKEK
tara:strand:- start:43 stop:441 length:399 start_codon:yes stop_codon:yes gene_type:complete